MNHKVFLSSLFFSLSFFLAAQDYGYKPGYNLVWHDEFTDSITTFSQWEKQFPWGPYAGGEQHYGQANSHSFDSTNLNLIIQKQKFSGVVFDYDSAGNFAPYYRDFNYSAGMLYSKAAYQYGFFECKFRSDAGKGFLNAFWLYGENDAEIDVFEMYGSRPERVQMTLHWRDKDPVTNSNQSFTYINGDGPFNESFQTFGVKWKADTLQWFLNQQEVKESNFTNSVRKRHIPQTPLNVIVSAGVNEVDGKPNASTPFPSELQFDYVRVYQQDTVEFPVVLAHDSLEYTNYEPFAIPLEKLLVKEHYNTFPLGFKILIERGEQYTVINNQVQVLAGFKGSITVNIRVNDGINSSAIFPVTIKPNLSVGIENEIPVGAKLKLYPNPANDYIQVESPYLNAELTIFSSNGSVVYQKKVKGLETKIPLSGLAKGNYRITVGNGKEKQQASFIRE